MSFLNIALLGGAAAFLAPLVIHLLNRARFKSLDWGAMHLLEAALQVNSRRVQWERWLLLLLRLLIPIILAFCLARPVLTELRVSGAAGAQAIVMLLDNSLSMQASAAGGVRWEQTIQELRSLANAQRSAEFSVWTTGGRPVHASGGTTFDSLRIGRVLDEARAGAGANAVSEAMAAGIQQVQAMSNPSKQLVIASDFQASDWRPVLGSRASTLRQQLATGALPVQLSLLRTHPPASRPNNLSVAFSGDLPSFAFAGEQLQITGAVHNHGTQPAADVRVILRIGESELSSRSISIPAGATEQVVFACEFTSVGWQHLALSIDDPLGISADDQVWHAVHITEPLRVLLVDVQGGTQLQHSSGYLQLALAPFDASQSMNPFELKIKGAAVREDDISGCEVVVLTDVPKLDTTAAAALVDFVRGGGGLVVFAGPQLNAAWYNQAWFETQPLLPLRFGPLQSVAREQPQLPARRELAEPLLTVFNGGTAGDLWELEFYQWSPLLPAADAAPSPAANAETSEPSEPATELLTLAGGDVLVAARRFGQGLVVQCGTSCSDDWSNMPLRPVFVPLMQRLVATAVERTQLLANFKAGDSVPLRAVPQRPQVQPATARIAGPHGTDVRWDWGRVNPLPFQDTQFPGLYSVSGDPQPAIDVVFQPAQFAVVADEAESDLELIDEEELAQLAEQLGGTVVDSADEFARQQQLRSDGQEIWPWLLAGLVVALFAEILLAQRITRGDL